MTAAEQLEAALRRIVREELARAGVNVDAPANDETDELQQLAIANAAKLRKRGAR